MRSRFSAYAAHLPEYIMNTTHVDHPEFQTNRSKWKDDLEMFMDGTQFNYLKISEFVDLENTATVTFTAYLRQADLDVTFTEKSTFEKVDGKWLYKSGQIKSPD